MKGKACNSKGKGKKTTKKKQGAKGIELYSGKGGYLSPNTGVQYIDTDTNDIHSFVTNKEGRIDKIWGNMSDSGKYPSSLNNRVIWARPKAKPKTTKAKAKPKKKTIKGKEKKK